MKDKLCLFIFSLLIFSGTAQSQPLQKIYTFAGNGYAGFGGDGNNASGATLWGPRDVAIDGAGNVYISDFFNNRVRKVNAGGLITTIAGNGIPGNSGNGSIGTSAEIVPRGLAVAPNGDLYISSAASAVIRKVNSLGIITAFAGTGAQGYFGNGGQAANAKFNTPSGICFDNNGNLYVADQGNHVVRKITTAGIITTIAGNNTMGYSGDGFPATSAQLDSPYAVVVDGKGNVYIDDYANDVIRVVDTAKNIHTFAGKFRVYTNTGDGGPATDATLNEPRGLAVDAAGNVYIADAANNVIRKVDLTGNINAVAGNGTFGFGGDLGFALGANLFNPYGIAVDAQGSIYISDANNERIRKTFFTTIGVGNVNAPNEISVYPNPINNFVTVSGLSVSDNVSIYDVAGRKVSETKEVKTAGLQTFFVADLLAGVYFVSVTDEAGNSKAVIRLVKE